MNDEIKKILIKDFNEILVKEFCTDWEGKRLYIELLVNSTPFSNLLDYITNLQEEIEKLQERIDKAIKYIEKKEYIDYNPTLDGSEDDSYNILPRSLSLYNEELDRLLNILQGSDKE